ncbi:hypothetical protein A3Q56_00993 [Intoshia linei]|uniref:GRAM domain-containing protein n=1 Tax=Intoshia linei TaxID=1819745 RepID=A0A177BAK6_9BILA|nr:hypothetical protein A3Q56_00993 [Intoshia linei]
MHVKSKSTLDSINFNSYDSGSNVVFVPGKSKPVKWYSRRMSMRKIENEDESFKEIDFNHVSPLHTPQQIKFRKLFPKHEENEYAINRYSCWYIKDSRIYCGSFYLTNNHIFFHNKFYRKKHVAIHFKDIVDICSHATLKIDNAIRVTTNECSYKFSTFLKRDKYLEKIKEQWTINNQIRVQETVYRKNAHTKNIIHQIDNEWSNLNISAKTPNIQFNEKKKIIEKELKIGKKTKPCNKFISRMFLRQMIFAFITICCILLFNLTELLHYLITGNSSKIHTKFHNDTNLSNYSTVYRILLKNISLIYNLCKKNL